MVVNIIKLKKKRGRKSTKILTKKHSFLVKIDIGIFAIIF